MSDRESQLEALIQASVDSALEKANAIFEKRLDGLVRKNEELLAEKKKLEGKSEFDRLIAAADRLITTPTNNPFDRAQSTTSRIVFDPNKHSTADYQRMRAEAQEKDIEFQVLPRTEHGVQALQPSSVAQFDHKDAGVRYIRRDVIDRYGVVHLNQQAEREGLRVRSYRSRDELPEDAIPLHDAAAKGDA